ncbi:sulfite exporter TauE/SafE family protein [Beggiatoa alba]|nr:sulfite exporter TauE/SafE family protein [Beggiatoa alba]
MDWLQMETSLWVLPLVSFFTAALTGVVGLGGGLLLLIIMAEFLAFSVLIPVHGINQLVTHFSRAIVSLKDIHLPKVRDFALGAVFGAVMGTPFILSVSESLFRILLGVFVLLCLILPGIKKPPTLPFKWPIVGALASFCGLFVGATGLLIAPFYLTEKMSKEQLIATKAASQVFIHSAKVVAFIFVGFTIGPYLLLIFLMCMMSFLGSVVAKKLLRKVSDNLFALLFRIAIVLLATRLIYMGVMESL